MLASGRKFGPYEILAPLGVGRMGEVYRARDAKLNRDVALKVLPEVFARDAERMARFRREAQVLASLNHPNIATIHGLEEPNGHCALVMEVVEGATHLERGVSTRLGDAVVEETLMVWSRDGKGITYATVRAGTYYLEEIGSDGSGPPRVLLKGAKMAPNDWSPDGRLLFMDWAKGRAHLEVYSASDHQVAEFSAAAAEAQFSADGKWIAYTGSGGRAERDIFVQPFPGPGGRIPVSSEGGAQPRWSHDGRQIFYVAPDRKMVAVSFDPQKGSAGAPHVLFQTRIVAATFALFQYDVSPDGRFLINSFPSNSSSPLTLLTGWTSLLNRQ